MKDSAGLWKVDDIAFRAEFFLARHDKSDRVTFLITAGPTREPIDPVRYISAIVHPEKWATPSPKRRSDAGHEVDSDFRPGESRAAARRTNSFPFRQVTKCSKRYTNTRTSATSCVTVRRRRRLQAGERFAG